MRMRRWAVGVLLLLGTGVALYMQVRAWRERQVETRLTFLSGDEIRLDGHRRILVGDSLCLLWPGTAHDVLAFGGQSSRTILGFAEGLLADSPHGEVVLWLGTAHYWAGHSPEMFRTDIPRFVELIGVRPYVIIGPLLPREAGPELSAGYADGNAFLAATYPEAYIDPAAVLHLPDNADRYYADALHVNAAAYAVLQPVVDAALARQRRGGGPPAT